MRRGRLSLLCLSLLSFDSLILLGERGLCRALCRLLNATTGLCRLRLVVHRVAHRALYLLIGHLLRGYLLIGRLLRRYLLIHRLILLLLLLLQHLPPNLTRTTARPRSWVAAIWIGWKAP